MGIPMQNGSSPFTSQIIRKIWKTSYTTVPTPDGSVNSTPTMQRILSLTKSSWGIPEKVALWDTHKQACYSHSNITEEKKRA